MAQTQPFGFACFGGLDINQSQFVLQQQQAGTAVDLVNFEVDSDGGYRRISGFAPLGFTSGRINNSTASDLSGTVLGLTAYGDGAVVAIDDDIYFGAEGFDASDLSIPYIRINRTGGVTPAASGGQNFSTFNALSVSNRTNQGRVDFTHYESDSEFGELVICDGVNAPLHFKVTGSGAFTDKTLYVNAGITISGATNPAFSIIHQNRLVTGGSSANPNVIAYSNTNDIDDFSGGGSITLEDKVVGLRAFRGDIIVFCESSIYRLVNLGLSDQTLVPITKNIGCISRFSIQEIGGDLVFLAPDGIRTVAATEKIGDTELGSVSRQIQPIVVGEIINNINNLIITSTVIRSKNQYRLFYSTLSGDQKDGKGIIGTLTSNGFAWSQIKGIQVHAITSTYNDDGLEKIFHGDGDGRLYTHDTGTKFFYDGSTTGINIDTVYRTPFFDFGDAATRKTLNFLKLDIEGEGEIIPKLQITFDNEDDNVPQPPPYTLESINAPSLFDFATFGNNVFSAARKASKKQPVQGSGHNISFEFKTDSASSFIINGVYVDYYPSGRR